MRNLFCIQWSQLYLVLGSQTMILLAELIFQMRKHCCYGNNMTWKLTRKHTSVKATKRLVSDQSGIPGVWPCHCSLSAVGKSYKPSDSHSLQDHYLHWLNEINKKLNQKANYLSKVNDIKQYLLAEFSHKAAKSEKVWWRILFLIPLKVINLQHI